MLLALILFKFKHKNARYSKKNAGIFINYCG